MLTTKEDSLYPYVNNDIEYGLFKDIVESYHLDSQIKDDFQCDPDCYTQTNQLTKDDYLNICTHNYQHIAQNIDDLSDPIQQNKLYSSEESTLSFTDDTDTHCDYNISAHNCKVPLPISSWVVHKYIYCTTLGNVARVYPWIVQGLTFLSA